MRIPFLVLLASCASGDPETGSFETSVRNATGHRTLLCLPSVDYASQTEVVGWLTRVPDVGSPYGDFLTFSDLAATHPISPNKLPGKYTPCALLAPIDMGMRFALHLVDPIDNDEALTLTYFPSTVWDGRPERIKMVYDYGNEDVPVKTEIRSENGQDFSFKLIPAHANEITISILPIPTNGSLYP